MVSLMVPQRPESDLEVGKMSDNNNRPSTASSQDSLMTINADEAGGEFDNINVVVRVRPLTQNETGKKDPQALNYPGEGQVLVEDPNSGQTKLFTFSVVFEPEATQDDAFEHCGIKRLIDMALDGFASTIMAYGQTGAGKTYTLTGPEISKGENQQPGIIQLAFAYLFSEIQQRKAIEYIVQASYLEIYKEQVLDLLNPSPRTLPVRWSKDKGFYAENLFVVECEDLGDLDGVLEEGKKNRQVRSHEMNEHSSRSHTILSISLASEIRDPDDPNTYIRRQGKLSLVDLAGSEKTKKTKSKGMTFTEANNINKSLLVLGNCISCLADPRKRSGHIPYRDSTLTKLLADSLGGSGMALIIACVSPSASNASETINTLRYASRAKRVKTKPMVRMDPRELLILSLRREVRLLRMENSYLRQQMMNNGGLKLNNILPVGGASPDADSGIDLTKDAVAEEGDQKDEKALLQKYMVENESLRVENATMHHMRELLIRDHEVVCRENERLLRRLAEIDRTKGQGSRPVSKAGPSTREEKSSTLSRNGSVRISGKQTRSPAKNRKSDTAKTVKTSAASAANKTPHHSPTPPRLSPTVRKIGNSLNDLPRTAANGTPALAPQESDKDETEEPRRNSWGSGIPKIKEKLSARSVLNGKTLSRKGTSEKGIGSVMSVLTGKGIRRSGSNRVVPATRVPAEARKDSAAQTAKSPDDPKEHRQDKDPG